MYMLIIYFYVDFANKMYINNLYKYECKTAKSVNFAKLPIMAYVGISAIYFYRIDI